MTAPKKRNLYEEIREGLEAYRHRRDLLPRHELPEPDVKPIRQHPISAKRPRKVKRRRRLG